MTTLLTVLLAFCMTISPESDWDCDYNPYGYGYTCDSDVTGDSYYQGITNAKLGAMTVYLTDGDSYSTYIITLPTR